MRIFRIPLPFLASAAAALLSAPRAPAALIINTTFASSVTSLSNAAQWESAWNTATAQLQTLFSDSITINITLQAGSGLGSSSTSLQFVAGGTTSGYLVMKADLLADAKTTNDATAYANLPLTDPTGGRQFLVSFANAKALGLRSANNPSSDGTVTIGTGNTYTFDPSHRAVAGAYDFIGVAQHEITEIMGRIGILGQSFGGSPEDDPVDLFGYSSPGVLNLNQNQAGVYFSIDGGVSSLRVYNNHTNGGDDKDWASGQGADAFNAFGSTGIEEDISTVDLQSMDVIGYDLAPAPEPTSTGLLALGASVLLNRRRR